MFFIVNGLPPGVQGGFRLCKPVLPGRIAVEELAWFGPKHGQLFAEIDSAMTMDKSLRIRRGLVRSRSVLSRAERLTRLQEVDRWQSGDSPVGLPKVRVFKLAMKKKKKKKEEDEGATADAKGGAKSAAKPAAKAAAKPAGKK